MPLENTHLSVANEILNTTLKKELSIFESPELKQLFLVAHYVPDIFSVLNETEYISSYLHGFGSNGEIVNPNLLILNLLDNCVELRVKEKDGEALANFAITMGIVGHGETDIDNHPWIYSLEGIDPLKNDYEESRYKHWLIEGLLHRLWVEMNPLYLNDITKVDWSKNIFSNIGTFLNRIGTSSTLIEKAFKEHLTLFQDFKSDEVYARFTDLAKKGEKPICYLSTFDAHLTLMEGILQKGVLECRHPVTGTVMNEIAVPDIIKDSILSTAEIIKASLEYFNQGTSQARAACVEMIRPLNWSTGFEKYGLADMKDQTKHNKNKLGNWYGRLPSDMQDLFPIERRMITSTA